jgi:hypothetical protein
VEGGGWCGWRWGRWRIVSRWINGGDSDEVRVRVSGCQGKAASARLECREAVVDRWWTAVRRRNHLSCGWSQRVDGTGG